MNNKLRSNGRSGQYVRQPLGFSAFIPTELPPPDLSIDIEMHDLLSKADRALGRLDGSIQTLPNPDLFVLMYIRKEAVLSSQIEGTQSSLADVLEAEARLLDPRRPRDVDEVINYIAALNQGIERLSELPISTRLIREIHATLMAGVRGQERNPGEIRTSQNWIGHGGSSLNDAAFVPPPPNEVHPALSSLEKFIHAGTSLPDLVSIGLVHAQFETIHPFLDGNGRVGRLLITLLLCEREILTRPVRTYPTISSRSGRNITICFSRSGTMDPGRTGSNSSSKASGSSATKRRPRRAGLLRSGRSIGSLSPSDLAAERETA